MHRTSLPASSMAAFTLLAASFWLSPASALGDGYETPNKYSARHVGMGGTSVAWVADPSALESNPAGLAHTDRASVLANVSLLFATLTASPASNEQSIDSELAIVPLPLIGASFRVTEWLTFGLGTFPSAVAGSDYVYDSATGTETEHGLALLFWEVTPAVAFDLPGNVRIGAGYRITFTTLSLTQKTSESVTSDFSSFGIDWLGFRAGVQYQPIPELQLGVNYRHKVTPETVDEDGRVIGFDGRVEADFVLPAQLEMGARGDVGPVGLAVDVTYGFNAQNVGSDIRLIPDGGGSTIPVSNRFEWDDTITVETGVEVRPIERLAVRAGYGWDQNGTQAAYASPWGTPPGDTHTISAGAGWDGGPWAVNVAWSTRFGSGDSSVEDVASRDDPCVACGFSGEYGAFVNGVSLDFSWDFAR